MARIKYPDGYVKPIDIPDVIGGVTKPKIENNKNK